jgi:hypothetical protein
VIFCYAYPCAGEYECGALVKEMNKKNAVSFEELSSLDGKRSTDVKKISQNIIFGGFHAVFSGAPWNT